MENVKAIWAETSNGVIGIDNKLPWDNYKEDLAYFKSQTYGHVVIMGYNTFASMGHKPLPGRKTIIVSSKRTILSNGYELPVVVKTPEEALLYALEHYPDKTIWIIGGKQIFDSFTPYINEWHQTIIDIIAPETESYVKAPEIPKSKVIVHQTKYHEKYNRTVNIYR